MRTKSTPERIPPDVLPTRRSPAGALGPRANRTIARILDATRAIFLQKGYAGTTIDEITKEAGISRASFYTYFPTKRDVLLTLAADSARVQEAMVQVVERFADGWSDDDLADFVDTYFDVLDSHASFAFAWTQAAHEDEEIRVAGKRRHLGICRAFGDALGVARGRSYTDPTAVGLAWLSLLERTWSYCELYGIREQFAVRDEVVALLAASLRSS